jgi:AraC-like DNA-binding protein
MKFERHIPADILKPYIKSFVLINSEDGTDNRILPDTSIVMVFRYKGKVSFTENGIINNVPMAALTGLRESVRIINYQKDTETLLVLFNEGGAPAFFNEPLHELFGISVSLDNFIPRYKINEIEERLAEAADSMQRIAIVEQFLVAELKRYQSDLLVMDSIQKIKSANGNIRIKELVKELHVSQDPFEKRFRKIIGISPKKFSVIVRLKTLIGQHTNAQSMTRLAYDAGYFDQSHFIKDFKTFTGQTPLDYFKSSVIW